jgi:hypothetical protein
MGAGTDGAGVTSAPPSVALTATLYQTRMDVAARQVEVRLANDTDADLTLRAVRLVSTDFAAPMPYAKEGSILGAGRVVDLPVALADPVCGDQPTSHTVHLDYLLPDGRTGSVQVPAADDTGQIEALHADECFQAEVAETATLAIPDPPLLRELDGIPVADLTVRVEPTGESGILEIGRIGSTTLLQQVDPRTGERLRDGYAVDLTVAGSDATSFTFTVVPGRCDAHAVAEDKQGTLFRLDVVLDGEAGQVIVASPPAVTAALYDFVREACAP